MKSPIRTNEELADEFLISTKVNPKHRAQLLALLDEASLQTRRRMGHKGGSTNVERLGQKAEDYFKKLGQRGGKANVAAHVHEHFVDLGKKGGAKVAQAMALLRAREAADKGTL